ncbi:MAG: hypothetical protein LUO95_04105, partial [Methylococcaceae bacterium]|nr:hypothetical protein [Methylococcaceae bacterium]
MLEIKFVFFCKKNEFLKYYLSVIDITHYDDNNTKTNLIEYHNYILTNGFFSVVIRLDVHEKIKCKSIKQLH